MENQEYKEGARGVLVKAFGNLLHVRFQGHIRQGEVGMVQLDGTSLKAEVIEIANDIAKLQVFEDIRDKSKETSAPKKLNLDIDRDEAFDYEKVESNMY